MSTDKRHLHRFNPTKPSHRPSTLNELTILQKHHQFIRDDDDDGNPKQAGSSHRKESLTWEDKLALSWYKKLFREYALCDLSQYKTGGIAMRWRTEEEVLERIGELTCGSLSCKYHTPVYEAPEDEDDERPLVPRDIAPYQLNFGYMEQGKQKHALVKVMLCDKCKKKLTWKKDRAKEKAALAAEANASAATAAGRGERQSERRDEEYSAQPVEEERAPSHRHRGRHRREDDDPSPEMRQNKHRGRSRSRSPQRNKDRGR